MKLIITIDNTTMTLQTDSADGAADRELYNLNSGIAVAANLRKALATCALLRSPRQYDRVTVVVDTPTMLIPEDEYTSGSATLLYRTALSLSPTDEVQTSPLDVLGVVLAFSVNKDLHFVLNENFRYVCFEPRLASTLTALSQRSYGGFQEKLFCVFRGKELCIIALRKHRLRFCNTFHADDTQDAVYYIMSVWQQLAMRPTDILMIAGNAEEPETLRTKLEQFVKNVSELTVES